MAFKKSESREQPAAVEHIAGGRHYVRKNIVAEQRESQDGEPVTMWVYDEALMTDVEYAAYSAVQSQESRRESEIVDEYTMQLIDEGVL